MEGDAWLWGTTQALLQALVDVTWKFTQVYLKSLPVRPDGFLDLNSHMQLNLSLERHVVHVCVHRNESGTISCQGVSWVLALTAFNDFWNKCICVCVCHLCLHGMSCNSDQWVCVRGGGGHKGGMVVGSCWDRASMLMRSLTWDETRTTAVLFPLSLFSHCLLSSPLLYFCFSICPSSIVLSFLSHSPVPSLFG